MLLHPYTKVNCDSEHEEILRRWFSFTVGTARVKTDAVFTTFRSEVLEVLDDCVVLRHRRVVDELYLVTEISAPIAFRFGGLSRIRMSDHLRQSLKQ